MDIGTLFFILIISSFVLPIVVGLIVSCILGEKGSGPSGRITPETEPWYKYPYPDINTPTPEPKEQEFDHTLETMIGYELLKKVWE